MISTECTYLNQIIEIRVRDIKTFSKERWPVVCTKLMLHLASGQTLNSLFSVIFWRRHAAISSEIFRKGTVSQGVNFVVHLLNKIKGKCLCHVKQKVSQIFDRFPSTRLFWRLMTVLSLHGNCRRLWPPGNLKKMCTPRELFKKAFAAPMRLYKRHLT